jgi:hypothetical protein
VGGIIVAAGVMELRGHQQLSRGEVRGLSLMVRGQLLILATIWLYAGQNLLAFDEAALMSGVTAEMRTLLDQSGIALADLQSLLKPIYYAIYLTVMGVTLLFQGGLALYYQSRRAKIIPALESRTPAARLMARAQTLD